EAAHGIGARARVDDQVRRTDAVTALQLVDERLDRLLAQIAGNASEVDQVAGVDAGGKSRRLRGGAEEGNVGPGDLFRPPHAARLGEDLEGLGPVRKRARERFVQST